MLKLSDWGTRISHTLPLLPSHFPVEPEVIVTLFLTVPVVTCLTRFDVFNKSTLWPKSLLLFSVPSPGTLGSL